MGKFVGAFVFTLSLCLSSSAQTSWVPYAAHFTNTFTGNGKPPSVVEGVRYRDTAGDLVIKEFGNDSDLVAHQSLFDATHQINYVIDAANRRALGSRLSVARFRPATSGAIGHEVVDGNATTVYPIQNPGSNKTVGKAWVIDGTDIIVHTYFHMPDGSTDEMKLTQVQLYQEPDHSLFQLPAGFLVSKP